MTIFFRGLASLDLEAPSIDPVREAFYSAEKAAAAEPEMNSWLAAYAKRAKHDRTPADQRRARMNAANPRFVLRNYLAQEAIDAAEEGNYALISELLDVMRHPYDEQPGRERFAARRPDWARNRAGCSMLSCSS